MGNSFHKHNSASVSLAASLCQTLWQVTSRDLAAGSAGKTAKLSHLLIKRISLPLAMLLAMKIKPFFQGGMNSEYE